MAKALGRIILGAIIVGTLYCLLNPLSLPRWFSSRSFYKHGLNPDALPARVKDRDMPAFAPGKMDEIVRLAGKDLIEKDLREITLPTLCEWTFDGNTRWPEAGRLPTGMDPQAWLKKGMDPGLGVRAIHQRGITGKGVAVAIFDKPMLDSHSEFAGRIKYRKVVAREGFFLHFHGMSCASLLAGSACGVAPAATLHYFSVPDDTGDHFVHYSKAMDDLLRINETLPVDQRIRVVSISDGHGTLDPHHPWISAMEKARAAGVAIVYAKSLMDAGFGWGGCPPMSERDDADNYLWASYWRDQRRSTVGRILVPACFRTTASNVDDEDYIYWGEAGFSWAIPYVAGVMALAWNVDARLTGDEIIDIIKASATQRLTRDLVINPTRMVELLESRAPQR